MWFTMIAGPNGAGKSQSSDYFKNKGFFSSDSIDPDVLSTFIEENHFLGVTSEEFQKNFKKEFNKEIQNYLRYAIETKSDFVIESNFRTIHELESYSALGECHYKSQLIFLTLDSVELSKKQVEDRQRRALIEGDKIHQLGDKSIESNFHLSLKSLDDSFSYFDKVIVFKNSGGLKLTKAFEIEQNRLKEFSFIPDILTFKTPKLNSFLFNEISRLKK